MDSSKFLSTVTASVVAFLGIAGVVQWFSRRLSPSLPYAGESTLVSRLSTPVLYGKDPVGFLCETRKKLGDVFCVDLMVAKVVWARRETRRCYELLRTS